MTWTRAYLPEIHARAIFNALDLDPTRYGIIVHRSQVQDVLKITTLHPDGATEDYEVSGLVWAEGPSAVYHHLRRTHGPLTFGLPYAQSEADIPLRHIYTEADVPDNYAYLLNPDTMCYAEEIPMYTLNIQLTRDDFAQGEEWVREKVEAFLPPALASIEAGDKLYSDADQSTVEWYVSAVSPDGEKIIITSDAGGRTEETSLGWLQDQILNGSLFQ